MKRLWYITVQFETGEIDILDEKDVEYDEDAPLKAKSKAKNNMSQVFCSLLKVL